MWRTRREMARSAKDARLDTRTARLKLAKGRRYQVTLRGGVALCYRRTAQGYGVWTIRSEDSDGREKMHRIGPADDYVGADGVNAFDDFQAQDQARELAEHRRPPPYTVGEAIEDYRAWFREHRKSVDETEATIKAHIRPALGESPVSSVTAEEIKGWRDKLARDHARKRTQRGKTQAHRVVSETLAPAQREVATEVAMETAVALKAGAG